jgi:hypothetical protein
MAVMKEAEWSANGAEDPAVPPADCGSTRYSAESVVEALAGNVTQPESVAGLIEVYPALSSVSCVPGVLQDASFGPALLLLHAAAISVKLPSTAMAAMRD